MEKITVNFIPKPEDYSTAIRIFSANKQISVSILKGFLAIVMIPLIFFLVVGTLDGSFRGASYIIPLLIFSFLVFLAPALSAWFVARRVAKQVQLSQPVTYEIGDEKIHVVSSLSEITHDWRVFNKVFETNQYYLLVYVTNKNMFQFLAKRAFESQAQENEFRLLIERKIGKIENIQKGLRGWKLSLLTFFVLMVGIAFCGLLIFIYSVISGDIT